MTLDVPIWALKVLVVLSFVGLGLGAKSGWNSKFPEDAVAFGLLGAIGLPAGAIFVTLMGYAAWWVVTA